MGTATRFGPDPIQACTGDDGSPEPACICSLFCGQ